ncbi:MAG: hypothetical protein HKO13_10520 [Sphingomonas sp.]|nr:hypothetical protein [Sphingomonas sp.]
MTNILKSLVWASIIILLAYAAKDQGMSDNAATGLVFAMVGAATASLAGSKGCRAKGWC